mgnify:CR=1 FL=1
MKLLLSFFIVAIFCLQAFFQSPDIIDPPPLANTQVFAFVEQMPEYPGGLNALMKFIQENVVYPKSEIDADVQGKVMIRFVIMEDGQVDSIKVVQSVSPLLDAEAIRVTKALARFKPGYQQGKPVRVYFNLPYVFKFENKNTPSDIKENKDPDFRNALSLIRYKDYKEALKALEYSISKFPNDYLAYVRKAECELSLGLKDEACESFYKAKKLGLPKAGTLKKKYCN